MTAIFRRLDETDPRASIKMLCQLDDHEAENIIGYGNGPDHGHKSGREFLELVKTFASDRLREFNLRQTVVCHLAKDDPMDALAYLQSLPQSERNPAQGRQLVQARAKRGDAPMTELLSMAGPDLPDGTRSAEISKSLVEASYERSPPEAIEWLGNLADGPTRDAAIAGYSRKAITTEPAIVYEWVTTISDPGNRQKAVSLAIRRWMIMDPDAATVVLPAADLSEEDRRTIDRQLQTNAPK